ncbi:MAG: HlyD family efflux transporter periplasmic adaptor subunit [Cyanobacteria bacterium RU_5_0]|nr:HlyD family efflux transporter periplasmic adaptor subunit [Cyanobacteria bacterium RU_5_0]
MTYTSPQPKPEQGFSQPKIETPSIDSTLSNEVSIGLQPHTQNEWSHATKDLLDALPQVWTRGLLYCLVGFAAIAIPWAMFTQVEITGTAQGRLEPQETSFEVDAPIAGTVAQVLVEEGQFVDYDQPLLELESDQVHSELEQAQSKLEGQLDRLVQLELFRTQILLAIQTQHQQNQAQESEKLAQVEQSHQSLEASKTNHRIVLSRLTRDQAEVERYRSLWEKGAIAEIQVVEQERIAEESQQQLAQADAEIRQAELRFREQQNSYQSLVHSGELAILKSEEQLKNLEAQMTTLQTEIAQSKSQIQSLDRQLEQHILRSPIAGVVFQLPIQKPGSVVQPSTLIAEIASTNTPLVLRSQIATPESGSLQAGMPVKLKFDAYPFQDYGIVEGTLVEISPTSKVSETAQGQIATFDLEIKLNQTCIQVQAECIELTPGQTATAEIIIRQRHIIDFILDPFRQLQQGGLEL